MNHEASVKPGALWLPLLQVKRITSRIHRLMAVPEQFGEGLYILRYLERQQYLA